MAETRLAKNIPQETYDYISKELFNDTKAYIILSSTHNNNHTLMLKEFIKCRYNNLNNKDTIYNNSIKTQSPDCNNINNCPNFGIVCRTPFNLSRKEYLLLKHLSQGHDINKSASLIKCNNKNITHHLQSVQKKLSLTGIDDLIQYAKCRIF